MKQQILKFLPDRLLNLYRNIRNSASKHSKKKSIFYGKPVEDTFNEIYKTNHWGSNDSISGSGSDPVQTAYIVQELGPLFKKLELRSVLDIPCGDFNWMKKVDLSSIIYTGGDIVQELINENKKKYAVNNKVGFIHINLIKDNLPANDLIFIRDCLVHLSYEDIFSALKNIRSSDCEYMLTTTFPAHPDNYNIITGDWRTLNLCKPPFNFPSPVLLLNEHCSEGNGMYADKSLGLWKVKDIPSYTA